MDSLNNLGATTWKFLDAQIWTTLGTFAWRVIVAVLVVVVGIWLVKRITKIVHRLLTDKKIDPTIVHFVESSVKVILFGIVFIEAIHKLGVESSSLIALVGAAGFAIGFAMKAHLGNVAAGLLMILFRPFSVGDYILVGKTEGSVEKIDLLYTQIRTPDNTIVISPNSRLTSLEVINFSLRDTRRLIITFRVPYEVNFDQIRKCLLDIIDEDERILKTRKPIIAIQSLGEHSVKVVARMWVKSSDHWRVQFDTTEKIKRRFEAEGIPFAAQVPTKIIRNPSDS